MAEFRTHPDPSQWDDYVDFESTEWPKKERRRYWIIPSICFNCESACGILAYVDKETLDVRKIEGNPMHPGSRGRTCARGSSPRTSSKTRIASCIRCGEPASAGTVAGSG